MPPVTPFVEVVIGATAALLVLVAAAFGVRRVLRARAARAVAGQVQSPPIAFALALLSATLALVFMRLLGTPVLDLDAYRIGVVVAAICGFVTGAAMRVLHENPARRKFAWALVPIAGAAVGMTVQYVLYARVPSYRTYILASGLTTADPPSWVLAGAPLGALPAIVAAGVLALAFRARARSANDDRERVMLPFAGACALLGATAVGAVGPEETPLAVGIVVLAALALLEIFVSDAARARWLGRIFAGDDPGFQVVPLAEMPSAEVPAFVAGVPRDALIVRVTSDVSGYRGAARAPAFATCLDHRAAVAPLRRRRVVLAAIVAIAPVLAGLSVASR